MKKIILIMFLLSTKLTFGQLINGDFEVWDTTYTGNYDSYLTSIFGVPNPKSGKINQWVTSSPFGASQTTDSYSGNYSLILHNWYSEVNEWITYHQPISYRPQYLHGYFKYITGGINSRLSHGEAYVTLTKFNGTTNDTIAKGEFQFDSTVSFTPFQITLNYVSASNPDSITIYIINSKTMVGGNVVCQLLYIDDLILTNTSSGIENINSTEAFVKVYPNPSTGKFTFQTNSIEKTLLNIFNAKGQLIISQSIPPSSNSIDLLGYADAIYFYELIANTGQIMKGKIIKHNE